MTDDFIVDLKDYIRVERKYPHEAWCDPDDVQAAIDEIERLQEEVQGLKKDSTIFIIERGEAISTNADLREEIERLRAALNADAQTLRLHLGEMTAQEMRTVRAAFAWVLAEKKTND
jgi:FtsZ-binding cell division protein ZapB